MTDKKSTTKGRAEGSKSKVRAACAPKADLAELISGLLNHPDTDASLYNTIRDELCEMPTKFLVSPTFIREQLRARGVPVEEPKSVEDRARAIVADSGRYNEETREAIRRGLDRPDDSLAEMVRRAEAGEWILDTTTHDEEPKARRDARDLLERQKRTSDAREPYDATGLYKPIEEREVPGLISRILGYDADEEAHALINLLHGIAAAHFAQRRGADDSLDLDGLVSTAIHHAYTHTAHFSNTVDEFALLDPGTFDAIDELRGEYFKEEPE